jgi:transmembrane sensor
MKEQDKPDWDLTAKYFAGEANENEQDKLHEWEKEGPEHEHELGRLDNAWTLSGTEKILFKINEDNAWTNVRSRIESKEKEDSAEKNQRILTSRFARMAAGFLLLAAIAAGLYMITGKLHSPSGHVSVLNEETSTLTINLSDGSIVSLNKGARLEYSEKLNRNLREVSLSGEAFFEVKPDALKPFIVHTQNASIKVVGTSFNVSANNQSGEVKVVVETGKVELQPAYHGAQKIILEKGNFGSYHNNDSKVVKGKNADINYLSWKTHLIRFDDTPLQEVTSVLTRTYHSEINLSGEELKKCKFTGTFSDESLDTVIKVLQTAFSLKIDTRDKKILLSGKGC